MMEEPRTFGQPAERGGQRKGRKGKGGMREKEGGEGGGGKEERVEPGQVADALQQIAKQWHFLF